MLNDKRKTKIVDGKTQFLIALEMMGHALILPLLIVIFVTTDPFSTFLSDQSPETHFTAASEFFYLNIGKWPLVLLALLFVGFLSIVFSHHIAGPSFRFVKALRQLKDKDLSQRIKLRRFDYLQNVSLEINDLLEGFAKEIKTIEENGIKISQKVEKLLKEKPELKDDLSELLKNAKDISDTAGAYKTS